MENECSLPSSQKPKADPSSHPETFTYHPFLIPLFHLLLGIYLDLNHQTETNRNSDKKKKMELDRTHIT
jgi:hypothetical protein